MPEIDQTKSDKFNSLIESVKKEKVDYNMWTMLSRYSESFISFISACLSFDEIKRPSINELVNHAWMKSPPKESIQVTIAELLALSNGWN